MRLIDADALKEHFSETGAYTCKGVREIIDKAPTVEERQKSKWINNYIDSDIGLVRIPDYFEGGSSND